MYFTVSLINHRVFALILQVPKLFVLNLLAQTVVSLQSNNRTSPTLLLLSPLSEMANASPVIMSVYMHCECYQCHPYYVTILCLSQCIEAVSFNLTQASTQFSPYIRSIQVNRYASVALSMKDSYSRICNNYEDFWLTFGRKQGSQRGFVSLGYIVRLARGSLGRNFEISHNLHLWHFQVQNQCHELGWSIILYP